MPLIEELKIASAVVWICPHSDDEAFFTPGILALSTMKYSRKTYVISFGGPKRMFEENQKSKEILGLTDYLYVKPTYPLRDCSNSTLPCFKDAVSKLSEKLRELNPSVVITFDPLYGYGLIGHANAGKIVTSSVSERKTITGLYYVMNKDEYFSRIRPNFKINPLQNSDIFDLDEYCKEADKTYWQLKKDAMWAYRDKVNDFKRFVETGEVDKFEHKEYFRKAQLK